MQGREGQLQAFLLEPLRAPATALEIIQGPLYPWDDESQLLSKTPVDPGLKDTGWVNPYRATVYPFTPDTLQSAQVLGGNFRRAYLVIQNKGPGNLFVNFGQAADALNSITLVPSQQWEVSGGQDGGSFIMRDSVYVLTDLAGTTGVILEGVAVPVIARVN